MEQKTGQGLVITVGNLEVKTTMSPLELGIVIFVAGIGAGTITAPEQIVTIADQFSLYSIIIGGIVWTIMGWMIIHLGSYFPKKTVSEYFPLIWGKTGGVLLVWLFIMILLFRLVIAVQGFVREVSFFMFDRTPLEVIIGSFLAVSTYCAMQSWGTIQRVAQLVFFTTVPLMLTVLALGFMNFKLVNILPLWPIQNIGGIAQGTVATWSLFNGSELLLLFLPLVYRRNISVAQAVSGTFFLKTSVILIAVLLVLGELGPEGTKTQVFPTILAIRNIELPGTFVERLDNYLLIVWVPIGVISSGIQQYAFAKILSVMHGLRDHRPIALLFFPLMFILVASQHDYRLFSQSQPISNWAGFLFEFVIIPLSILLAWLKFRR